MAVRRVAWLACSVMIDERLDAIARHPFRARFRLRGRERALVQLRGMATIRADAEDLVAKKIGDAEPYTDGKQTPYRGHPVFVAQHATATCCRTCLERWHAVPKGRALTEAERAYVADVICRWIERERARDDDGGALARAAGAPPRVRYPRLTRLSRLAAAADGRPGWLLPGNTQAGRRRTLIASLTPRRPTGRP